ncbi:uncharacterized protein SETTUDRAFT_87121 [Exserohilum turcica Et28A]|uniref:Zn(2)-C6 fungal-type domain-containing protein n=1 Tax=Exserohilum turcicum (strain 28A) TaxID=671987 RepID=R0KEQ5_EXST2|nr:uncharacterized protein SETTUDRAFT_87121 [Exserohilum turcica Et28A]EOA91348.1 hypothetical protein SETTUDRAFT_87121 [Exserohilum turcica Et28A]
MEYENPRTCLSQNIPYPNCGYGERNAPLTLAHNTRENPRSYPVGGPVGGMHNRGMMAREDSVMETGPARRRIAVACARCRKRKIRCSGDPGNGSGCINCRQASVDPMSCQFHRVGSDSYDKVIGNFTMVPSLSSMANAQHMVPLYQTGGSTAVYPRSVSVPSFSQYQQTDNRSVCNPVWAAPYSEDMSPVDTYNFDQPPPYASIYGSQHRGGDLAARPLQYGGTCFDHESLNASHYTTSNGRLNPSDLSPLDTSMASLQLSVSERLQPRQPHPSESSGPRRELPVPQPNLSQSSRNVVDQMQDARLLRYAPPIGSIMDNRVSFSKPLIPWDLDGSKQTNAPVVASVSAHQAQLSDSMESPTSCISTTTSAPNNTATTSTSSQLDLSFSTAGPLDGMSAPTAATPYSCVRASRHMAPADSPTNLYGFGNTRPIKRNASNDDLANECSLVSGHRYSLNPSPPQNSQGSRKTHRDSCKGRNAQLQHAATGNLNACQ